MRAQHQHQRRHVVAGIAIGDIAADCAAVAHLRIGDQQRRLVQDRQRLPDLVRRQQFVLGGHGADHDLVAVAADALQPGDAVQVDQMFGGGEPKLHHRHQAVAAGQRAGFVAQCREQFDRIGHARGPVIAERARNHGLLHVSVWNNSNADVGGAMSPVVFTRKTAPGAASQMVGIRTKCGKPRTKCVSHRDLMSASPSPRLRGEGRRCQAWATPLRASTSPRKRGEVSLRHAALPAPASP